MFTIGAMFVFVGLAGILGKAWVAYRDTADPPMEYRAKVAKTRLDTKKDEGKETYTYIATFLIHDLKMHQSFQISQSQFDVLVEKEEGILTCNLKRKIFIEWTLLPHGDAALCPTRHGTASLGETAP